MATELILNKFHFGLYTSSSFKNGHVKQQHISTYKSTSFYHISPVMIERIYLLCLIIIIKSEVLSIV